MGSRYLGVASSISFSDTLNAHFNHLAVTAFGNNYWSILIRSYRALWGCPGVPTKNTIDSVLVKQAVFVVVPWYLLQQILSAIAISSNLTTYHAVW